MEDAPAPSAAPSAQTPPPNSPPQPHAAFPTAAELGAQASGPSSSSRGGQQQQGSAALPSTASELHHLMMTTVTPNDLQDKLIPILLALSQLRDDQKGANLLALEGVDLDTSNAALEGLSLAYASVITARLLVKLKSGATPSEDDISLALRLVQISNKQQLAMCLPLVSGLAWALLRSLKAANRLSDALEPLHALLQSTSAPDPRKFNGVHAALLEACLITRHNEEVYPTLAPPYLSVDEGTSYLDVLTYHHHAGLVAAAANDYALATQMFVFATAAPTTVPSAIQLACAKRAILCELLNSGKSLQMPKETSAAVNRMLEKTIKDYKDLAKAFEAQEWKEVTNAVQSKKSNFTQDANYGLVQKIVASIPMRRILTLRPIYSRIKLSDLARKVGLTDGRGEATVKEVLEGMVSRGEIRASVSGSPEVVTFEDDDNDYDSPAEMARLMSAQVTARRLLAELTSADRDLSLQPKWLEKQVRALSVTKEKQGAAVGKTTEGSDARVGGAVGNNQADFGF